MPPFPPSHLCLALLHGHRKSRVVLILQYYREPFNENSSFHCALMSTPHSFSCIHSFILSFLNHQLCDNWAGVQGKEAYLGCLSLFQSYTPLFCPMKILCKQWPLRSAHRADKNKNLFLSSQSENQDLL